jgi:hypothetical protein
VQFVLPNRLMTAMEIFSMSEQLIDILIFILLIGSYLLCLASAEMRFFKLKFLKSHLKSTMSQERLNDLAIICIEKKLLDEMMRLILRPSMTSHLKMREEIYEVIYTHI